MDLKDLPFADSVPLKVRHAMVHAELLFSAEEVAVAVDRLAIHLSVDWQDENPVCVVWSASGIVIAGMLMQRMIFPLQLAAFAESHAFDFSVVHERRVLLIDALLDPLVQADAKASLVAEGAIDVSSVVLVSPTQDVSGAANSSAEADYVGLAVPLSLPSPRLIGCGLTLAGYGANLPGLYLLKD